MTHESQPEATSSDERKLSVPEKAIVALCLLGIVAALAWALNYSGIALFDGHAAEVLSGSWNRTATIGILVALVVAAAVGLFVWWLAKSTLFSESDPETLADITA